ncbi:MAG: hypothetical protein JO044_14655 [Mycobacteriaceae bacterium]|nr:hypothetical protein [Mycobacteriaceae bacterium]MBV9641671.1 hypothetical protein [Mycobacteriaceae bacterium]
MMCASTLRRAAATALISGLCVGAVTSAPVAAAQPGPDCDDVWGARVQGAPPYYPGDRGGVYLWHDQGFHLRATHRVDDRVVYAGTVVSPTPMHMTPVALEDNDRADLSPDGRTLWFSFVNYGHTDGVDFTTDCADYLTVGPLTADNVLLTTDRIYLGATEIHPENNPLTIHRHEP